MKHIPIRPVTGIIAAAGSGTRMGGVSKPLLKIGGRYALLRSLDVLMRSEYVERVVISARREDFDLFHALTARENYPREVLFAEGGETRQESVRRAFEAAFDGMKPTRLVAIHDAARPLLTDDMFDRVVRMALHFGNAVCAAKAVDTYKISDRAQLITEAVDRETLWQIQTPQVFDTDMFHTALALAAQNGTEATDESSLLTAAGFLVKLCECGRDNIKLTHPEDMVIAEALLHAREEAADHADK